LRRAYEDAVDALRSLMRAQVDAVSPGERQLFESAHEQVIYQQGKCDSLLKVLMRHVAQHGCVGHTAARTATHR
jgi:hypothetical protein